MENNVHLYPEIEEVVIDTSLECYLRPVLICDYVRNSISYKIPLFALAGVFIDFSLKIQYSENGLFGFDYNGGLLKFLRDVKIFEDYNTIPDIFNVLREDFNENDCEYLDKSYSFSKYYIKLEDKLKKYYDYRM
jgi:hypothetical protein